MVEKLGRKDIRPEQIVEACEALAEKFGMDFSMRELAEALNTWPNAIYGHFPTKALLQKATVDFILGRTLNLDAEGVLSNEDIPWQDRFRILALALFTLCEKYKGLGPLLTHDGLISDKNGLELLSLLVTPLKSNGLSEQRAMLYIQTAATYIATMGEMAAKVQSGEHPRIPHPSNEELAPAPLEDETLTFMFDFDKQERVLMAIEIFITSAEHEIARGSGTSTRA